ncbi:hypothetical protein [Marinomonas primoryensis]|uniref:hypothetical protein n=1 Tax=Marinomonas primoryensis TaxID=178399 RepID=UPI00370390A0
MATETINNPFSESLIMAAMENLDFMEFVEVEGGERVAKDIESFFADYSDLHIEDQLDDIKNPTLIRMWRFFVAYMFDLAPYSETTNYLIRDVLITWEPVLLNDTLSARALKKLAFLSHVLKQPTIKDEAPLP